MPRNGAGGFSLPAGNPVVTGTTISSADFNNTMTDIATAVAGSIAADGQTAWQGNQNANNNRITSLAAAAALTDAPNANDVQTGKLTYLSAVAGTNTITATVGFLTAYTAGEVFRFIAANTNTGASTLNVNGIGAIAITKQGATALAAGDIKAGALVSVAYDGAQFQLQTPSSGQLIGVQRILATSTYTPTPGTNSVVVELCGGGGAGGGCSATAAGQIAAGGGGGAGGPAKSRITSGFSGVTVTIGAGGTGVIGGAGNNGGTTSFGALFSATGGAGGSLGANVATGTNTFALGGAGGVGTGGSLFNSAGQSGGASLYAGAGLGLSGAGGASMFGGGAASVTAGGGVASVSVGSGGSGGALAPSSGAAGGGPGAQGICIVWEYA